MCEAEPCSWSSRKRIATGGLRSPAGRRAREGARAVPRVEAGSQPPRAPRRRGASPSRRARTRPARGRGRPPRAEPRLPRVATRKALGEAHGLAAAGPEDLRAAALIPESLPSADASSIPPRRPPRDISIVYTTEERILAPAADRAAAERSIHAPPQDPTALLLAARRRRRAATLASAAPTLKGRAVWANPREAGMTEASVVAFVEQLEKAHVNTLIMELKTSAGLFWPSERFAPAVVAEYEEFDLPGGAHPRVPPARDRLPRLVLRLRRGRQLLRRAAAPGVAGPEPRGQAHERRGPAGPALPHGLDVPGATARLHRPVAHPADQGVRGALRRGRDPPRLRALPGRPRPRHVLLLRLLPRGDPEVRLLLLDDPPRRPPPRAHGPPPPRGALGEEPEGPAPELEGLRARDEEPVPARGQLLPGRQPRPRLPSSTSTGRTTSPSSRARSSRRCGRSSRGWSSRPRSSRTPCRAGASSARTGGASRRGSSTSCRWTTAATTPGTSRPTSTCWPRASSSRRPGRATSRTSGPASRPTSSTTRSGSP